MSRQKPRPASAAKAPSSAAGPQLAVETKAVAKRRDKDPTDVEPLSKKAKAPARTPKRAHDEELSDSEPSPPKRVAASAKGQPKPASKAKPEPAPKAKPEPKPEPKQAPEAQPPKAKPAAKAQPEPKPQSPKPKPEPKRAPEAQPPKAKPEPMPAPAAQPPKPKSAKPAAPASQVAPKAGNEAKLEPKPAPAAQPAPKLPSRKSERVQSNLKTQSTEEADDDELKRSTSESSEPHQGRTRSNSRSSAASSSSCNESKTGPLKAPSPASSSAASSDSAENKEEEIRFSDIPHTLVLTPTYEEFKNFQSYIESIYPTASPYGMVLIRPPVEYHREFAVSKWPKRRRSLKAMTHEQLKTFIFSNILFDDPIPICIQPLRQTVKKGDGSTYGLLQMDELKEAPFDKFIKDYEKKTGTDVDRSTLPVGNHPHLAKFEEDLWKNLFNKKVVRRYTPDNPGTFYPDTCKVWNLTQLGSLLKYHRQTLLGVNTPFVYVALPDSVFGWHSEDMELFSVNVNQVGQPKQWYCLAQSDFGDFVQLTKDVFPKEYAKCGSAMRHKQMIYSPLELKKLGFTVYKATQFAGDFMVTFPQGLHCGFNYGFNVAEAVNAATPQWFPFGRAADHCKCKPRVVKFPVGPLQQAYEKTMARKAPQKAKGPAEEPE